MGCLVQGCEEGAASVAGSVARWGALRRSLGGHDGPVERLRDGEAERRRGGGLGPSVVLPGRAVS